MGGCLAGRDVLTYYCPPLRRHGGGQRRACRRARGPAGASARRPRPPGRAAQRASGRGPRGNAPRAPGTARPPAAAGGAARRRSRAAAPAGAALSPGGPQGAGGGRGSKGTPLPVQGSVGPSPAGLCLGWQARVPSLVGGGDGGISDAVRVGARDAVVREGEGAGEGPVTCSIRLRCRPWHPGGPRHADRGVGGGGEGVYGGGGVRGSWSAPAGGRAVGGGGGSQPHTGQSTSYGDVKSSYGGAGGWDRRGCATWAPRSATRQGEEQHRHTERGSHTKRDKGEHSRQGVGAQQGRKGNQNSGKREPEWSGWWSVRKGGSDNKGDGLASQPGRYRVPGQPLLNRHQVGGVSRSPDGLFAQHKREPIEGRPAVRGKSTYGGRPGQRVEEQGTWAAQKHSAAGYGRPVDRGVWTAKTVKRPRQQPAHPQCANYWAPLTRERHIPPHPALPQHTKYWAPRTRKRHQQEHRPQRPTERSDPTQRAEGRTGDCPGPRKGTTTRRTVTRGGRR